MLATAFDSGFALGHDTYNGMIAASDGAIYYVLCAESCETGGQMYRYDPASARIDHCGDLTAACGESGSVSQSKSHVNFVEAGGKL